MSTHRVFLFEQVQILQLGSRIRDDQARWLELVFKIGTLHVELVGPTKILQVHGGLGPVFFWRKRCWLFHMGTWKTWDSCPWDLDRSVQVAFGSWRRCATLSPGDPSIWIWCGSEKNDDTYKTRCFAAQIHWFLAQITGKFVQFATLTDLCRVMGSYRIGKFHENRSRAGCWLAIWRLRRHPKSTAATLDDVVTKQSEYANHDGNIWKHMMK